MARGVVTSAPARALWRRLARRQSLILTYHRFASEENGGRGTTPADLRRHLAALRRSGCTVVPLERLLFDAADLPPRPVAITVDDGYADFVRAAMPVFRERSTPVTMFLTTGFVDRTTWLWWDRLDAATAAVSGGKGLRLDGVEQPLRWDDEPGRRAAVHRLAEHLERMRTAERERSLEKILASLGAVPDAALPMEFAPLTWEDARRLESEGVRFGPHTVRHPVLALTDDRVARHEVETSWRRLRAELRDPLPVFAYPNGGAFAWTDRDAALVAAAGIRAAVTMTPRFLEQDDVSDSPFAVPRVAAPDDEGRFLQLVCGFDYVRRPRR